MIELIDFGKKYGDFTAVECLNLKIDAGEMFGFIGPNGAGKSTSIGFSPRCSRPVTARESSTGTVSPRIRSRCARALGICPIIWRIRRDESLGVSRLLRRRISDSRAKRKQVIGDVLELLDLMHKRDDFVNGLSRGMKQRLCLAKTLVHDPPVLILDEPSSGLDPRARLEVKALVKELRRMGKTILISSHILTELADCCTSIGIIERGQLLMHGPIDEVYRRIRGNRMIEIKFLDGMEVGLSIIRSCPHTRNLQIEDHQVTVELAAETDEDVSRLMHQLANSGARLRSFHEKDPTLEDVFMLVTKGLVI